jgi:hypothetical protein
MALAFGDLFDRLLTAEFHNPDGRVDERLVESASAAFASALSKVEAGMKKASSRKGAVCSAVRQAERGLEQLWQKLSSGKTLETGSIEEVVSSSALSALSAVMDVLASAGERDQLHSGGALMSCAMTGAAEALRDETKVGATTRLLSAFGNFLAEEWKVSDVWGPPTGRSTGTSVSDRGLYPPLSVAIIYGANGDPFEMVMSKNASVDGTPGENCRTAPLFACFQCLKEDFFARVLARGPALLEPLNINQFCPFTSLLASAEMTEDSSEEATACRLRMLSTLFSCRPELLNKAHLAGPYEVPINAVGMAVLYHSPRLLNLVCASGGRPDSSGNDSLPTIMLALQSPCLRVFESLIKDHGILGSAPDAWEAIYKDEKTRDIITHAIASLASSRAFGLEGEARETHMACLELFCTSTSFRRGFINNTGLNIVIINLNELGDGQRVPYLRHMHGLGFDVVRYEPKNGADLHHVAATLNLVDVLDYAIGELGCDVNARCNAQPGEGDIFQGTSLYLALQKGHVASALRLVERWNARVSYPDDNGAVNVLFRASGISDEACLSLLKLFTKKEPHMFVFEGKEGDGMTNSLWLCVKNKRWACLEWLLVNDVPGTRDLCCHRPWMNRYELPIIAAVEEKAWNALYLILKYSKASVLTREILTGTSKESRYTVLDRVRKAFAKGGSGAPSRIIMSLVEARAKEEREQLTAAAGATTGSDGALLDNTFEESTMKRIVTAKQAKDLEKRKENKKKARARKRAAAKQAAAGAGKAEYVDSSEETDESEGEDDEPGTGHLINSRNAPDLTMMLAARRAAREKEEKEAKEKERSKGVDAK